MAIKLLATDLDGTLLVSGQPVSAGNIAAAQAAAKAGTVVTIATGRKYSSFRTRPAKPRPFTIEKVGLMRPRAELYARIDARVDRMMEEGLLDEVRRLVPFRDLPALNTVGYKELFSYLDGACDLGEAVRLIKRNTRHYAKKQMTWWARDPAIRWIDVSSNPV